LTRASLVDSLKSGGSVVELKEASSLVHKRIVSCCRKAHCEWGVYRISLSYIIFKCTSRANVLACGVLSSVSDSRTGSVKGERGLLFCASGQMAICLYGAGSPGPALKLRDCTDRFAIGTVKVDWATAGEVLCNMYFEGGIQVPPPPWVNLAANRRVMDLF
jgi:hypothetical protein